MRIKLRLCALFFFLALNAYAQQSQDFEIKKKQVSRPKTNQSKDQKSQPVVANKNKTGKDKPFIPSEEVSPDIPVSFPADI